MSELLDITEGWTGLLGPFTLRVDGAPVPLTGMSVELKLHNVKGVVITPGGVVTVLNQITNPGQVTYSPIATDFTLATGVNTNPIRQPFYLHWKVTDMASKVVTFPNGEADTIIVHRV